MQIHELPTISGSPSGGYFATDNGTQTTKIDYTALAQAIIEQYNASTLAGSAQSVKAALDGIGELAYAVNYKGMGRIAQNDDLNSYTTPGSYVATSTGITTSLTNCPINNSGFSLHVESVAGGTGQLLIQTIKRTSSNIGEVYLRTYTGSVWGAWEKVPTRAEVDALNSNLSSLYCREYNYETGTSYKAAVTDVLSKLGDTRARYWIMIRIGNAYLSLIIIKDGAQWSNGILTTYGLTTTDVYFVMSRAGQSGETVVFIRKFLTGDLE